MTDSLYQQPEKDGFKSESPIRAFTDFKVNGNYAIGKGFRPSLAHLTEYLDAMLIKEGWQIVQILEATSGHPSMVFFRTQVPVITIPPAEELNYEGLTAAEQATSLRPLWAQAGSDEPIPDDRYMECAEFVLRQLVKPEYHDQCIRDFKIRFAPPKNRRQISHKGIAAQLGFILPRKDLVDIKRLIDEFRKTCVILSDRFEAGGRDPEYKFYKYAEWSRDPRDSILDMFKALKSLPRKRFLEREKAADVDHFLDVASVASVLRLTHLVGHPFVEFHLMSPIDATTVGKVLGRDVRQRVSQRAEVTSERRMGKDPNLAAPYGGGHHRGDPYENFGRRVSAMQKAGLLVDPGQGKSAIPDVVKAVMSDDPVNPKHYAGRACADIGERLSANGYQILKYCWRLGKKDDPCQELGKALWYEESEMALLIAKESIGYTDIHHKPFVNDIADPYGYLEDRIADEPQFVKNIARMLWAGYNRRKLQLIGEAIQEHRFHLDCGRGLAV